MNGKIIERFYPALAGALTTLVAQALLKKMWQVATGEAPPDPTDPDVPTRDAVTWFVASSLGVGVAQLLMGRFTSRKIRQWKEREEIA